MNEVKVAREHYHRMSPKNLPTFALGVRDGVYVLNPTRFPTPPVTQVIFEGIIEDFETKRSAFVNGGTAQKGPYLDALAVLMTALDEFADMVDEIPSLTTAIVLEGGFTATKESDSEHHVPDGSHAIVNLRRSDGALYFFTRHDVCPGVDNGGSISSVYAGPTPACRNVLPVLSNVYWILEKGYPLLSGINALYPILLGLFEE